MILAITIEPAAGEDHADGKALAAQMANFLGEGAEAECIQKLAEDQDTLLVPVSGILFALEAIPRWGYKVVPDKFSPAFIQAHDELEAALPAPYRMSNLTRRVLGLEEGPVMMEMLPVMLDAYRSAGKPPGQEELGVGAIILARLFVALTRDIDEDLLNAARFGEIYKFVAETESAIKEKDSTPEPDDGSD